MASPTQYVTLVTTGGTPVRLANQQGAPYPTTGTGALVFANGPTIDNATLNSATLNGATLNDPLYVYGAPTVADLKALVFATSLSPVATESHTTLGDGGGGLWVKRTGDHSAAVTADPRNGLWAAPDLDPTGATGAWQRIYSGAASAAWFGLAADNSTNDYAAFNAALNSGAAEIEVPPGTYRVGTGLVIPDGVEIYGLSPNTTTLMFDLAVPTCITLGTLSLALHLFTGLTITRAAGSIPGGSIGVLVNGGYNISVRSVTIDRQAIPIKLLTSGSSGISFKGEDINTFTATENHVLIDSWPESRWSQCRFGGNGVGVNCNAYVRYEHSHADPIFPNGSFFDNCQFNQGDNNAAYWLDFDATGTTSSLHRFDMCYTETVNTAFIHSGAGCSSISRLSVINSECAAVVNIPFLDLNAATSINEIYLGFSLLGCGTGTTDLTAVPAINALTVIGCRIQGNWNITSTLGFDSTNATVNFIGNQWLSGTLTLAGTGWGKSIFMDAFETAGHVTNTAVSKNLVVMTPGESLRTWTPTLAFGGDSTGITYHAATSGAYQIVGSEVRFQGRVKLTSKGAATGFATMTGPPFPPNAGNFQTGAGGTVVLASGMLLLTATTDILAISDGGSGSTLYLTFGIATGTDALTNANFTDASEVQFNGSFFL